MEHKYKVGDTVRILEDEYVDAGLTIGSVHPVYRVVSGGLGLKGKNGRNYYYCTEEVEPYTTPTPDTQYIRILEAIAGEQLTTMASNIHEALQNG